MAKDKKKAAIGAGVGVVVILGLVAFALTRKKEEVAEVEEEKGPFLGYVPPHYPPLEAGQIIPTEPGTVAEARQIISDVIASSSPVAAYGEMLAPCCGGQNLMAGQMEQDIEGISRRRSEGQDVTEFIERTADNYGTTVEAIQAAAAARDYVVADSRAATARRLESMIQKATPERAAELEELLKKYQ